MAAKRRPRRPLRSELSDGIRKTRRPRPIKTVAPQLVLPKVKKEDEVVADAVVEEVVVEELPGPAPETDTTEVTEGPSEEELEEQRLRDLAKDLGVKNWWNKKIETLQIEIEGLQSEIGE